MLDNNGMNIMKIMKLENYNVYKATESPKVKDDFNSEREKGRDFKEMLSKPKSKKVKKDTVVEVNNKSIVVDSSLDRKIKEQRILKELIKEKFIENPEVNNKISFEDIMSLEEWIELLLKESDDNDLKADVSEQFINTLKDTISKLQD